MPNVMRWFILCTARIFGKRTSRGHHRSSQNATIPVELPNSSDASQSCREQVHTAQSIATQYQDIAIQQHFYDVLFRHDSAEGVDPADQDTINHLQSVLHEEHLRITCIPRMPYILPQLMSGLRDEETSRQALSELIKKDPAIAGEVLRLANSAFFRRTREPVTNIEQAIFVLGFNGIRAMISNIIMKPILQFHVPYYKTVFQLIWQHSIQCAHACQHLAQQRSHDPFTAYFLGLIHDIGTVVFLQALLTYDKKRGQQTTAISAVVKEFIRTTAPQMSLLVAADWDLPEHLRLALAMQSTGTCQPAMTDLGDVLFWGNRLSELSLFARLAPQHEAHQATHSFILSQDELHETYMSLQKSHAGEVYT